MKKVSNIGNDILGISLVYQTAGGGEGRPGGVDFLKDSSMEKRLVNIAQETW